MIELYNLGYSVPQISKKMNCDPTTVRKVLRANGIKSRGNSKMIDQFDLAGNYIQTFDSTIEAAEWILENNIAKGKKILLKELLINVVGGERKQAYEYKWCIKNIPE